MTVKEAGGLEQGAVVGNGHWRHKLSCETPCDGRNISLVYG